MNTALILIDIQNDYFENGNMPLVDSEKACENAKLILEHFRAENMPIVHIQHIAARPTATFFLPNTKGADIHNNVKPSAHEKIIVKHYPNSFRETELLEYLNDRDITNLIMCGMMTHMCVDATARAAKDHGFNITLIGDACATKDLEINGELIEAKKVHNSFLAALSYFYATVISSAVFLNSK